MSKDSNIEGLKAGVSSKNAYNPYNPGTDDYEDWENGYKSGMNADEVPVSSDMIRLWNE